jgi:hypothetical protein
MRLKLIICCRTDGLGVRFNNYMHAKTIANYLNIPCLLVWVNRKTARCSFKNLFMTNSPEYYDSCNVTYKSSQDNIMEHVLKHYNIDMKSDEINTYQPQKIKIIRDDILENYDVLVHTGNSRLRFEHQVLLNPYLELQNSIGSLPLNPYISTSIKKYSSIFANHDVIGFHIRRGDCVDKEPGTKNYNRGNVSLSIFYDIIGTGYYNSNQYIFFVCSDDDEVMKTFTKTYKYKTRTINNKRIRKSFYHRCRSQDRNNEQCIQDAMATMILLSKCKIVYGSNSSFNKIGTGLGGVERWGVDIKPNKKLIHHKAFLTREAHTQKNRYNK